MDIKTLALLACLLLTGCASGEQQAGGSKRFPLSVRDLLLMTPESTLEQVEAAIGPPPRRGAIVEARGPFATPDHYWVEYIVYYGDERRRNIEIHLHEGWLGPCFKIDDLPELIGAREVPPPIDGYRRTFMLNTERLLATFRASHPARKCLEMIYLTRR